MPSERRVPAPVISTRWGSFGDIAAGAFLVAAASGVALAVPYDPADAYGSIARILLASPGAAFLRNLHYWSGQVAFVLALVHVWDHLRARTETLVARGVWLRLAITLPLLAFLMLSGFMLRGDAEGRQALRIVAGATSEIPLVGGLLATLIFGAGERLDLVYVQHAATATLAVWIFVIEHARRVWPRVRASLVVIVGAGAAATFVSPGLHDGIDPIVKGPWYFLGLQEILHWTSRPVFVVLGGLALVAVIYALREVRPARAAAVKATLLALVAAYAGLCLVGAVLRGENWTFAPTWPVGSANLRMGFVFAPIGTAVPQVLPLAGGRPEGCLVCHGNVEGLGSAHRPEAVGCASCHGGDPFTLGKARAHAGMELMPGNLATARLRCGQSACHPTVVPRLERSIMTTLAGIIDVDRIVFGEQPAPATSPPHVGQLGRSAADTHLRQLCASCHLGAGKTSLGPNGEDARGGGCNACHLAYSPAALDALRRYERDRSQGPADAPTAHPAVSLDIGNGQCFGCHSRSSRISTSYEGWHEAHEPPAEARDPSRPSPSRWRVLADERVFERVMPDVHQQLGLDCIDCHTATEVMGDGTFHSRKREQLRVACGDCHGRPDVPLPSVPAAMIDPESRKILTIRQWPGPPPERFGRTADGEALVNVALDDAGAPVLVRKRTGERLALKPARPVCVEGAGHARLSCGSCHTAWAPRCPTCHTSFDRRASAYDWVDDADVTGAWQEESGPFVADLPTLGVRQVGDAGGAAREVVETFVPGMVLTIDPGGTGRSEGSIFRRLYARIEPHTTRRDVRSCASCHSDPVALGYGRGDLRYETTPSGGRWRFSPASPPLQGGDGIPADAWIPFLGAGAIPASTRDDVRPFTIEEQQRILRVGACLTCHDPASRVMRDSVQGFEALVARRSPRCVMPVWN